jgi:hypothetical protein
MNTPMRRANPWSLFERNGVSDGRKGHGAVAAIASTLALLATIAIALVMAPAANAAFGDTFGIADINDGPDPLQDAPAYPGTKAFFAGTCDLASPITAVGTAPANPRHCIEWSPNVLIPATAESFAPGQPPSWRLAPVGDAGTHGDGTATFSFTRLGDGAPDGSPDTLSVQLPAGFVGDPTAVAKCTNAQFALRPNQCPPASQVGIANLVLKEEVAGGPIERSTYPVYNLEPRPGRVAELGIPSVAGFVNVRLEAKARTNGDFGVTTFVTQIPAALPLYAQSLTVWGVPWATNHDLWRPQTFDTGALSIPASGLPADRQAPYSPSWGPIRPFISNVTECAPVEPVTGLVMDSFEHPGARTADGDPDLSDPDWKRYESPSPVAAGCEKLPFDPSASFTPSSTVADSPSGLNVDISVPQNDDPPVGVASDPDDVAGAPAYWRSDAGLATSQLDKSVVVLPEGLSVNPSGATGLEGCSDGQMGVREVGNPYLFNNVEPSCPDGSKIGTVEATTPLLDGSPNLVGDVFLGTPKSTDPQSGEMFRMFLVLRSGERGLLAKVFGSAVADPATGRLTATFDKNPRVPVEGIEVGVKGGQRGLLATPRSCGAKTTSSVFTPWTAAHGGGGIPKTVDDSFVVSGCSNVFAPVLAAGMDSRRARGGGRFSFRFSRRDGEPYLRGLTATLPKGLLASVRGVPLCSNTAANAGACPQASKIGLVDAKAGAGSAFVLERKGEVFLTEGYNGGAYGLAVKIRPVAGPFRGSMELSPITVRQSIRVDRLTAQVTAVSDPFPLIHHGVPLRVREVTVLVNKAGFMVNPSGCEAKQVAATIRSDQGSNAQRTNRFQASGCSGLPFKPRLGLRLTGRRQMRTGKHPGVKAVVKQAGTPEAGIERAEVRLPKTLALDPDNAQALCEYADGTRPDIENRCPKGSIVGRARAVSPLLNDPLVGNVYFVKNYRVSETGNRIATLPMLIVALRGEIAVNLKGTSDVKGGKLVNTFDEVPDAPVSQFNLNIVGGNRGILAVTRTRRAKINLCAAGRQIAEVDTDAHNGRRRDFDTRIKTPCKRTSKAARKHKAAKRAAAKRKRA